MGQLVEENNKLKADNTKQLEEIALLKEAQNNLHMKCKCLKEAFEKLDKDHHDLKRDKKFRSDEITTLIGEKEALQEANKIKNDEWSVERLKFIKQIENKTEEAEKTQISLRKMAEEADAAQKHNLSLEKTIKQKDHDLALLRDKMAKIIHDDDDVLSEKLNQNLALIEKMKNQLQMKKDLAAELAQPTDDEATTSQENREGTTDSNEKGHSQSEAILLKDTPSSQ